VRQFISRDNAVLILFLGDISAPEHILGDNSVQIFTPEATSHWGLVVTNNSARGLISGDISAQIFIPEDSSLREFAIRDNRAAVLILGNNSERELISI
jgi:hypothetical protein